MYLKVDKKIEIKEMNDFKDKWKSFRFYFNKIDFGLLYKKRKLANTYWFVQRVDICFTDENDIILDLIENVRSEKLILRVKSKNIYYLPLNTCKQLKIGKKLPIKR